MATPIRVLFVIDELDVGGTEQQILELVTRLDRRVFLPMVCCFRPGRIAREIEAAGVAVFTLRKRAKVDPGLVARLVRLIRRERIDLVQTYLFTANTWGRLAAILAGARVIVSSERNVDMWEERYKQRLGTWLDRWTSRTIANSQAVAEYLVKKGLPREKIRVIYNGVDGARFDAPVSPDATKAALGIPSDHVVVGLLARLEPQKDPRAFLEAAAIIAPAAPAVSFLVIGGGSLLAELKRAADALGIGPRVVFTGPTREVPALLAACDVSVMSSVKEGMSNTVMESMAAGKPMVATRVGGNAELIEEGETGLLVPPRDPAALARAIQRIVEDPALARAMGRQARERIAERCSVAVMVASTARLYEEAMAAASDQARPAPGPAREEERNGRTVALVASQFPRYVDAYFLREISALAARGVRFRIFSLRDFDGKVIHAAARPLMARTVYVPFFFSAKVLRANARALARTPGRYLGALGALIRGTVTRPRSFLRTMAVFPKSVYFAEQVRAEGLGHIHANWASHPAAAALVMSKLTGVPWSFAGHASDIYLDGAMLAEKLRAAKFVITCTRHNRDFLAGIAGPAAADRIVVSYHGVDLDRFRPLPDRPADTFRILTAGTLRGCKGLPDLIEAGRLLALRGIAFDCSIVGDGSERRSLERLIRRAGLEDRMRITGFLSQEDLIPLYQRASVVVLPARSDTHFGIPNILLEAFAVGTPVICTPLPSLAEVMEHGRHGLYVPEQNPAALADALESLARDPERGRAMGVAGRRAVEDLFDTEKNTAALETLFRSGVPPAMSPALPLPPPIPAPRLTTIGRNAP
jgi:glycosyltransferase involved in cell wall biosynthesis